MIRYAIVNDEGEIIRGESIKTPKEDIKTSIHLQKSVVFNHISTFEIIVPVGTQAAIIYEVRKLHSGIMLRVLSLYCMAWGAWMWVFDSIEKNIYYENINNIIGKPQNEMLFYIQIILIGLISLISSFFGRYKFVGFTLQAVWWLFLTMFFAQQGPSTAILIYGSYFVISLSGIYLMRGK